MPKKSQQSSDNSNLPAAAEIANLHEELNKAKAEKAILELQLREYSEKLDQKVHERTRELEAINCIATAVSRSLNLEVILRDSLSMVLGLLQLDVGAIFLVDDEKPELKMMAHQGLPHEVVIKMNVVAIDSEGCPGQVVHEGRTILVDEDDDDWQGSNASLLSGYPELKLHLGIPLESKGQVRGVMCLFSSDGERFSPEDIKLLATIGSEIGVAIENAWLYEKQYTHSKRMEELSITDSLTGLYNRRHFYRRLKEEMARAIRQGNAMSLLIVDLDNLKKYNDERGHLKGDEALRGVARAIKACIRQNVDSGYRYGGDEFAVILPYSDEMRAAGVAERIRNTYEDFAFPDTGLSIGLAELKDDVGVDELVSCADSAMYAAKNTGGNKVHIGRVKIPEEDQQEEPGSR